MDAVVIATGNDFRAVEAAGHTYASRSGRYSSLTHCSVEDGRFRFWIELPLALGTVGGLTALHPMVKLAHEMLGHPTAEDLMKIVAVSGLAQNFGALRALVTTGIQKGHMKMHLFNILNQLEATEEEPKGDRCLFRGQGRGAQRGGTQILFASRGCPTLLSRPNAIPDVLSWPVFQPG